MPARGRSTGGIGETRRSENFNAYFKENIMADYSMKFAFFLDKKKYGDAVLKDIQEIMRKIVDGQKQKTEPELPEWFEVDDQDVETFFDIGNVCNFEMGHSGLHISHGPSGHGDPETAAYIIRQALKHNNSDACAGFQFAYTCSVPRLDEFGGGAVFITKDEVKWTRNLQWLSQKMDEHKSEQAAPTP
jgi:hypothetical protein